MKCPKCGSEQVRKNGHRRSKQNYRCKSCDRQFVKSYSRRGYSEDVRQICLRMNQSGVGFREIERLTGISHNTIINWVRQTKSTSDKPEFEEATESSETNEISESLDSSKTQNLVVQQIRFNNLNNYLRLT